MPAENQESGGKEVTFTCASCQYCTTADDDFAKHCKSEHRNELSLWCIKCDKCFSNCGLLVAHIKEDNCVKEEMIYRCGAKECTFKTEKGQVLVHHLRHVHRGSPFLHCVECEKLFTLPHCLILHMQNECSFKEKHRKNPNDSKADNDKKTEPEEKKEEKKDEEDEEDEAEEEEEEGEEEDGAEEEEEEEEKKTPAKRGRKPSTPKSAPKSGRGRGRGRGAGRGRGRGRSSKVYHSESSGSDIDDPSWNQGSKNSQPVRRSSRSAKKVITNFDSDDYEDDDEEVIATKSKRQKSN